MNTEEMDAAVRAERLRLSTFLDGLDESDWAARSLCAAWTVREVVAHLTVTTRATLGFVLRSAIRARGNFDRMTADVARRRATTFGPAELVRQLRESAESSRRIIGSGPMDPLMDLVVHGQDIARPLEERYPMPRDVVEPVLSYVASNRLLGAPDRLAGLELVAADLGWTHGTGALVSGPAEQLLLAASGRAAGLTGLTGPGVPLLTTRLAA